MGPEIVAPVAFFITVIAIVLGVPLVRAHVKRQDRHASFPAPEPRSEERLARIEASVESIAIEVERISEGQRFVTKLLAERAGATALPKSGGPTS